jgi:hypothetical protein
MQMLNLSGIVASAFEYNNQGKPLGSNHFIIKVAFIYLIYTFIMIDCILVCIIHNCITNNSRLMLNSILYPKSILEYDMYRNYSLAFSNSIFILPCIWIFGVKFFNGYTSIAYIMSTILIFPVILLQKKLIDLQNRLNNQRLNNQTYTINNSNGNTIMIPRIILMRDNSINQLMTELEL